MKSALLILLLCCFGAFPALGEAKGTVRTERFRSAALGSDKEIKVYLPSGYDPRGATHYPVFYYLHGLGGDETTWLAGARLDDIADAMGLQAIVVMPDGDANFYVDPPGKLGYETYIVRDLIGWIDRRFKTIAAREGRAIAGMSMGGYGALALAMRHPDKFSAVASHSGIAALLYKGPYPYEKDKLALYSDVKDLSGWYGKLGSHGDRLRELFGTDLANWRAHDPASLVDKLSPGQLAIYLDCGSEDAFHLDAGMQYLHDRLVARRIEHAYYYGPGAHDIAFWKERLPRSLEFLRDRVAKPVQRAR